MPEVHEIVAEVQKQKDRFETNWTLPWYEGPGTSRLWGHRLLRLLLELPETHFGPVIDALLADDSFALRGIALHLLNARKLTEPLPRVREMLAQDESVPVRALAASTLAGAGLDDENRNALLAIADMEHAEVRKAAVAGFRGGKCQEAVDLLARWANAESGDEHVRVAATIALGEIAGDSAAPILAGLLQDESGADEVRAAAAAALGSAGSDEAVNALTAGCSAPRPWVRAASLAALSRIRADGHVALFVDATATDNPWMVRGHAAEALGRCTSSEARSRLEELLDDGETNMRSEAVAALGNLGGMDSAKRLGDALEDGELLVRVQAVHALGKIADRSFGIEAEAGKQSLDPNKVFAAIDNARAWVATNA